MKAAKDRQEEFYDPAHKDNILGRNTTRLELWEKHLKDLIVALDKALKCVEEISIEGFGPSAGERCVLQRLMMASETWVRSRSGRAFGPTWMRWKLCVCAVSMEWNRPEKYGPQRVLLFFLIQKKLAIVPNREAFNTHSSGMVFKSQS